MTTLKMNELFFFDLKIVWYLNITNLVPIVVKKS